MKNLFTIIGLFTVSVLNAQTLVSITPITSLSVTQVQAKLSAYGWSYGNMDINPVKSYKVVYNTTDSHGMATVASGAVFIPQMNNCDYAPITVYEHGTEFQENNVPSTGAYSNQGAFYSTSGYIAVLPDYLGLGSSLGYHLYHHAETEATATLDLIRAVREYLDTASNTIKDNGQVFITGYSHGGHSAMATAKYIQEHNLFGEFNVVATAPLSGAYSLNGSQYDLIFDGDSSYYASPFLPYILTGMQEVYGNLYNNLNEVYDSPYDANIAGLIANGNSSFFQWYIGIGGANYYTFMQDSVLNNMLADVNRDTHPINVALMKNNVYDWVPERPVRMMYCGADSMVSPVNATFTLDTMLNLGATEVMAINMNNNADHNGCFQPATTYALNWFDSLAVKCAFASIDNELDKSDKMVIYPNPASELIQLNGVNLDGKIINIVSLDGKQSYSVNSINNMIDIKRIPASVYVVIVKDQQQNIIFKGRFVKE